MHQAQWSPERPLPPPVSLASQSHHEKPPEVTCTSRGNPGFPASTRERPRETFFNTSRGHIPLPWLGSNDALPLATRMETRLPWRPTRGSLTSPSYLVRNRTLGPPLENNPEIPPSSREGIFGFTLGGLQGFFEFTGRAHDVHALAAAACRRFDQQWKADTPRFRFEFLQALIFAVIPRRDRYAGFFHQADGRTFRSHRVHALGRGADEYDARLLAAPRELAVLGEKTITRMNRFGACLLCGGENAIHVEVRLGRPGRADVHGFIRHLHVQCVPIRIGIHRDGGNAQALEGTNDATSYLAAIGDEDFLEHENRKRAV